MTRLVPFLTVVVAAVLHKSAGVSGFAGQQDAKTWRFDASQAKHLEINGHGILRHQDVRPKQLPAAYSGTMSSVGGSASRNAFTGEEQFLREADGASEKTKHVVAVLGTEPASTLDNTIDVEDGVAAKADSIAASSSRDTNSFAAEQKFLDAVSTDASHHMKWAGNGDQVVGAADHCVCGKPATSHHNGTLSMANCESLASNNQMDQMCRFILPTGTAESSFGVIRWAYDQTQCVYVHNGWTGNGNSVHLWPCVAQNNEHFQAMNFTFYYPQGSGFMAVAWAQQPGQHPNHCVDVDTRYVHHLAGGKVVLWDCSAGALWKMEGMQ